LRGPVGGNGGRRGDALGKLYGRRVRGGNSSIRRSTSLIVVELYTEIRLLAHLLARCNLEAFFLLNHPL
jgi:hypothetical protein